MRQLIAIAVLLPLGAVAQDSTGHEFAFSFTAGITVTTSPVYHIVKPDTSFVQELSLSPVLDLQHRSGIGLRYSPAVIATGKHTGLQYHQLTAYYEKYDSSRWNLEAYYSRYFFPANKFFPESPIENEAYAMAAFKAGWIRPALSGSYGWGRNDDGSDAYDFALSAGVGHRFAHDGLKISWELAPSLSLNAGTASNYSFLKNTKYISRSKKFLTKKKSRKSQAAAGSTDASGAAFAVRNLELGLYSSLTLGSVEIVPAGSVFLPFDGSGLDGYWQLGIRYHF